MPLTILALLQNIIREGQLQTMATNRTTQFGTANRRYLGATILPERMVYQNAYRDEDIRFRTIVANDGERYSPAQLRGNNAMVASMLVELGHQDIAAQLTGADYDRLLEILNRSLDMEGTTRVLDWIDTAVILALVERIEIQRWQALSNAQVTRLGDNGFSQVVNYSAPSGHRPTVAGDWTDSTYNIFDEILGACQILWDKGYQVNRIVTSRRVSGFMSGNESIARRIGRLSISGTTFNIETGRSDLLGVNQALATEGLPNLELYDLTYNDLAGTHRFMPNNEFYLLATTGRDETIELEEGDLLIENTLGYTAIGRGVGQQNPGRVVNVESFTNKPPRIEAEGWQTSLPVIQDPEALVVLKGIDP